MERKLSKTQTLQTDIEKSVDAIMGQEIEIMALRLSGQLLLGVVRIYSRKAKYLLDDCNEALLKIKMAFRPGPVDLNDDELVVSKNSITLAPNMVDLDLLLPDVQWDLDFEHRPDTSTLEVGRDASPSSIEPYLGVQAGPPLERSTPPDFELPTFESVDLEDFGVGFDEVLTSPSSIEPHLGGVDDPIPTVLGDSGVQSDAQEVPRQVKAKKQIVDTMTELRDGEGKGNGPDAGGILADHQYLRSSSIVLQLLKIHVNPTAHFFRGKNKQHGLCDAPYGIGPELKHLFTRPAGRLRSVKRNLSPQGDALPKRRRVEEPENVSQLEFGRRGTSPAASLRIGSDLLEPEELEAFHAPLSFGVEPFPSHSQQSDNADAAPDRKGFSKNTVQALEIIQNELGSVGAEKVLSFQTVSNKASRRAAASFFFELLVLGTRDCLKLTQTAPFENIEFSAKEKFWTILESQSVIATV
ncbi:hypothetical protein M378DRAFT_165915 [Amanita muscaria Koide BX008]|uniref:Uncharacterized protein n=1 Tax=Amanita muscaria (strain Koide BX008) TaxID=946122 RepID=A0A0C2X0L8_AMAMK|nr:hypothetical protein M378DRAFT_165915 [Amanita muscaria Koide BX008]